MISRKLSALFVWYISISVIFLEIVVQAKQLARSKLDQGLKLSHSKQIHSPSSVMPELWSATLSGDSAEVSEGLLPNVLNRLAIFL